MRGRLAVVVFALSALPTLALGADRTVIRDTPNVRVQSEHAAPYPLSWRAAKVRRAEGCWRACLGNTGRDFQTCLRVHGPTVCVAWNAGANHHCLRECRLAGGPWVNVE